MNWFIAGGVSWLFGNLGIFIAFTVLAFVSPRTMQGLLYLIGGAVVWGGGTIILAIIGMLFGFLPPSTEGFQLAAGVMAIPSFYFIHKLAASVSPDNT